MLLLLPLLLAPLAFAQEPAERLPPELDAWGRLQLGWLEQRNLWTGDPLLGGFDLASSSDPLNRIVLSPEGRLTTRFGVAHRVRLHLNGRSLMRYATLDEDLAVVHGVASDGVPIEEAWKERLFFDEASYRWRPDGDPAVDLRLGILPFSIASGRLLADSWPGARFRLDGARKGWFPLALEARGAISFQGTRFMAASLRREPSLFEHYGLEASLTHDPNQGLTEVLEQDLGMLTELWRDTSGSFIDAYEAEVLDYLATHYADPTDGLRSFQWDLQTFLDLHGSARMAHYSLVLRRLFGSLLVDGALIHGRGQVSLVGNRFPEDMQPGDIGDLERWETTAPRVPFQLDFAVRGWAWDLALSPMLEGRWQLGAFFQGMTGDDDLVGKALAGEPVSLFLATDQDFLRTRLFPAEAVQRDGALGLPPGVAGHGLMAPGLWFGLETRPLEANLQLACPLATHPSPLEPYGRLYGCEADLLLSGRLWDRVLPQLEAGLFQPGSFFLDASDGARDQLLELPLGWRLFAALTLSSPRP